MENPWVGGSWKWEAQEAKNRLAVSSTSLSLCQFRVGVGTQTKLYSGVCVSFDHPPILNQSQTILHEAWFECYICEGVVCVVQVGVHFGSEELPPDPSMDGCRLFDLSGPEQAPQAGHQGSHPDTVTK